MLRIHLGAFNFPPPVAVWGGCKPDQFLSATIPLFSHAVLDVYAAKTLTRLNVHKTVSEGLEEKSGL